MRLTLINQFYVPDLAPTAHLACSLAEHRAAQGDDVTVITSRGGYTGGPTTRDATGGDATTGDATTGNSDSSRAPRVIRVWSPRLGGSNEMRRLIDWATFYILGFFRVVTLPRQDCLIAMTTPPYIAWAAVFHRLLHPRARVILWSMDYYPDAAELAGVLPQGGWIGKILRLVNRALFARVQDVVCLDGAMLRKVAAEVQSLSRRPRIGVIPNWERASFFTDAPTPATAPRDPASLPDQQARLTQRVAGRLRVLYLGNTGYGHDFRTILSAAEMLRGEPVEFAFVGGGPRKQWIATEKDRRGLSAVEFFPYVAKSQTPALLAAADCALITLEDAALGIMSPSKLHASLATGVPILYLGPRGSNVDEAIERFGCGLSARVGDAPAVARFLRRLLTDPDFARDLGRRARTAFQSAYTDTVCLAAFDQLLRSTDES